MYLCDNRYNYTIVIYTTEELVVVVNENEIRGKKWLYKKSSK